MITVACAVLAAVAFDSAALDPVVLVPGGGPDPTRRAIAPDIDTSAPEQAVRDLLDRRAAAVAVGDTAAWRSTLATAETPGVVEDIERFDAMLLLPVTGVDMRLDAIRHRRAHSSVRVCTSYRLGSGPLAEHRDDVELVATPDGWRLGGSRPVVPVADGGTVPPWYLPGVTARRTATGDVVLVWPGTSTAGPSLADLTAVGAQAARRAVPRAGDSDGAVVAAPDTPSAYRALVPGTGEVTAGFAAVTAAVPGPASEDGTENDGGHVVVIDPGVWPGLDNREQQVILTHELVHVAVGGAIGDGQPPWLAEGHADHVALGPVLLAGTTRGQLAGDVLEGVKTNLRTGVDTGLPGIPDAADFASDPATAYPTSWLLVDYLVRTYGDQAALDMLALLAGAGQGAALVEAEDRTMRQVLGVGRTQIIQGWRADLAALATAPGATPSGTAAGVRW